MIFTIELFPKLVDWWVLVTKGAEVACKVSKCESAEHLILFLWVLVIADAHHPVNQRHDEDPNIEKKHERNQSADAMLHDRDEHEERLIDVHKLHDFERGQEQQSNMEERIYHCRCEKCVFDSCSLLIC